jgi:hypothetical protein
MAEKFMVKVYYGDTMSTYHTTNFYQVTRQIDAARQFIQQYKPTDGVLTLEYRVGNRQALRVYRVENGRLMSEAEAKKQDHRQHMIKKSESHAEERRQKAELEAAREAALGEDFKRARDGSKRMAGELRSVINLLEMMVSELDSVAREADAGTFQAPLDVTVKSLISNTLSAEDALASARQLIWELVQ